MRNIFSHHHPSTIPVNTGPDHTKILFKIRSSKTLPSVPRPIEKDLKLKICLHSSKISFAKIEQDGFKISERTLDS